ncbi:MAG: hypothetical protein AAGU21_01015 [Solidesulfovibrio sp.]|uniref:portal protein n=1 Tax=Solidesulfovibrio sp. TaxID=2910990 RepID=UPI00315810FC
MPGLLLVKSNAELEAEERAEALQRVQSRRDLFQSNLASHIQSCWQAARQAKEEVQQRMLRALRQRTGLYEPDKLAAIQEEGGPLVFMMLTDEKCTAAEAWLEDILLVAGEKPWAVRPTKVPDLSPDQQTRIVGQVELEVLQGLQAGMAVTREDIQARAKELQAEFEQALRAEAERLAGRMEYHIEDLFQEGGWYAALREAIQDIVTFPAGFIKGPVIRRRRALTWGRDAAGDSVPVVSWVLRPEWECVSPFDIYPSPSAKGLDDGDLCELVRMTPGELHALIGVEGYDEAAIRQVLEDGGGRVSSWLWDRQSERARLEDRPQEWADPKGKIEALNYWGQIQGQLLLDWGIDPSEVDDPEAQYQCEAWQIGPWTIKAQVNPHPLGKVPYHKASFRNKPGSFWGIGVPEIITDCQDMCNASARNLAANMAITSGPQVGVDLDQVDPTTNIRKIYPWKVWPFKGNRAKAGGAPISFYQASSNIDQLMKAYDKFSLEADTKTGIPKYIYGSGQTSGVLNTASGFSMMVNNATKGIKRVVGNIDTGVTKPSVTEAWVFVMLYDPDPSIKGDVEIVALGSSAMMVKEQQQLRRNEFMQTTSNPVDLQIMGMKGRAQLLRESLKSLDFTPDKIVPSEEELQRLEQAQQQAAQNQMQMGQLGGQPAPARQGTPMLPDGSAAGGDGANLMRMRT